MTNPNPKTGYTAFCGGRRVASGALAEVAVRARSALTRNPGAPLLVFDDATGAVVEVDLRGSAADVRRRVEEGASGAGAGSTAEAGRDETTRRPGRPRLGVVAREVTLLPRHWEWLGSQPGGASVALRRLVEEARKANAGADRRRRSQEAAYRFMSAVAGDYAGYEEALRALFAGSADRFHDHIRRWPADVRAYATRMAEGALRADEGRSS
jgi:hypothetical protein